ncbi:hypothetical protein CK203_014393 [Vitis vinifera]|uniref:Uncharacterized protein n=1 Tax=Vitis vinifera TaxID=29760 RepID=A0A438K4P1_VITVI|nr:hypothetical protein CK203_014393 [Vitis vinifera]
MHDLQPGDLFVVYKDESSGKYVRLLCLSSSDPSTGSSYLPSIEHMESPWEVKSSSTPSYARQDLGIAFPILAQIDDNRIEWSPVGGSSVVMLFSNEQEIVRGKKAVKPAHAEDKDGSIHRHRVGEADRDWYRQIWPEQGPQYSSVHSETPVQNQ